MQKVTEKGRGPEFLKSEANGHRSRENIVIGASQALLAGRILGKVTASGEYVAHDPAAEDGSEKVAGILYDNVTTAAGETAGAVSIERDAEVFEDRLSWGAHTAPQKAAVIAALKALGIIAR